MNNGKGACQAGVLPFHYRFCCPSDLPEGSRFLHYYSPGRITSHPVFITDVTQKRDRTVSEEE
jgi:hypothetical protein